MDELLHTAMQKYMDTLCTTQQQMNLITSLLHDIPTFHGGDTTKLKDWHSDIEMAADILKESQACLTEATSCSLTHTLFHEKLQAWKCWDDIRDILHLNLCNTNIHTYTLCFMGIQQRDNEMLAAYVHQFKIEVMRCDFNSDTATICIFVKGLQDTLNSAAKIYEKKP